jgi:IPT/TIG domain
VLCDTATGIHVRGDRRSSFRFEAGGGLLALCRASIAAGLLFLSLTCGPISAQTSFPRGDSDCNVLRTAADVVAATRGFGGMSSCQNDDCDRDGEVTGADVDCTARCLFGTCPVPPDAPRVSAIVPDSTDSLTPFSVARITGVNFGDGSELMRVTIGGVDAPIVDFTAPDTILVIVPNLPPGPTEVVVIDGDVAGAAAPLTVGPPTPVGEPDTFEGAFQLLDTQIEQILALDLSEVFGEDEAFVRAEIERLRGEIAADVASLLADPAFSDEERAALDAAIDASDAPERLRQDIQEPAVEAAAGGDGGGAQTAIAVKVLQKARTIRVVAAAVQAAVEAAAPVVAPVVGTAVSPVLIVAGVGTALVGGILVAASDPLTPLITGLRFRDSQGQPRRFPTVRGTVEITGARFDSFSTDLKLDFYNGSRGSSGIAVRGDGVAVATIPDNAGVCGFVNLTLSRTIADVRSNPVPTRIQPELLGIDPSVALPSDSLAVATRGISVCGGVLSFSPLLNTVLSSQGENLFRVPAPDGRPAIYEVRLVIGRLPSEETREVELITPLTGLRITCAPTSLELKNRVSSRSTCEATLLPVGVKVNSDLFVDWRSSDNDIAGSVSISGVNSVNADILAAGPGTARVTGVVSFFRRNLTSNAIDITVVDRDPPFVTLSAPESVEAGSTIVGSIEAGDAGFVRLVVLRAMGDAAVENEQGFPCGERDRTCELEFRVDTKDMGFRQREVTLVAEAFDASQNSKMSNPVTVRIRDKDTTPPVVQIQAPQNGGRVRAGDTVQVAVRVTDNGANDVGVAVVRVDVAGAAVASPPNPAELELEMPLKIATRIAPFTVKGVQDLANIPDRTITITATGTDGSGNMASAMVTVTAGTGPLINRAIPNPSPAGGFVRIIGEGFGESQGTSTITFGGVPSPLATWSNTEIIATIPENASGMVPVVVTVDGVASNAVSLTVLGSGDVQITLVWDDTNDLDLHVIDPSGEEIFYNHTMAASGGRLDVDANAGCGSTTSSPRENIFWPTGQAPNGTYTVRVVFFEACTDPAVSSPFTVNAIVDGSFMTLFEGSIGSGSREVTFTRTAESGDAQP